MRTNNVFFKNSDRSEALVSYIEEKANHLHYSNELRWIVEKENKSFTIKCLNDNGTCVKLSGKDPYHLITSIIHKMKAMEAKKYRKSA